MYPDSLSHHLEKTSQRLKKLITAGKFNRLSYKKRQQWINRVQRLKQVLSKYRQDNQRRKIIAGATLVLSLALGNTANAQIFNTPQLNPFGLNNLNYNASADMDNDGDVDFIFGGNEYGTIGGIRYFENTGTAQSPSFVEDTTNASINNITTSYFAIPSLVDIDADGDYDLFVTELYSTVKYYENIGTPTSPVFSTPQTAMGLNSLFGIGIFLDMEFADMDNDGDFDVFAGNYYLSAVYVENTGDSVNAVFNSAVSNPFGFIPPAYSGFPALADIDLDGDMDLFIQSTYYSDLFYYENTGTVTQPTFSSGVQSPFNLVPNYSAPASYDPLFVDIDADGDLDFFATYSSSFNSDVFFQENLEFSDNIAPTSSDTSTFISNDGMYNFSADDFPFSDIDSTDNLVRIKITALPIHGTLFLSGNAVTVNQEINVGDISSMTYDSQSAMTNIDSYGFDVSDGVDYSDSTYVFAIIINALPTTTNTTVEMIKDTHYFFDAADFMFNDVDGGSFQAVQILTIPTKGQLRYNTNLVSVGDIIPASDLMNLAFASLIGETGFPYTDFQFAVSDGTDFSQPATLFVEVDFPISTNGINENNHFEITPNPTSDFVNLRIQAAPNQEAQLSVTNLAGQIILNQNIVLNGDFNTQINVNDWAKGVYIIQVKTEEGTIWTEKIVVQ